MRIYKPEILGWKLSRTLYLQSTHTLLSPMQLQSKSEILCSVAIAIYNVCETLNVIMFGTMPISSSDKDVVVANRHRKLILSLVVLALSLLFNLVIHLFIVLRRFHGAK